MPAPDLLIFGRAQPPADLLPLRAGRLAMLFDPEAIFLRRITLDDREIIRGIYAAVRDQNWGTVPPQLQNLIVTSSADSFRLTFDVSCRHGGIDFFWRGEITGKSDSTVRFTFSGEARSTFLRNRIGLCVLHPIRECAGARASFAHRNSWKVELAFPSAIEPQIRGEASFSDMRSLAHEVRPGVWAELIFEGEIFEMEDQRNWTDASFRTYGTPLAKQFPVEIESGTRLSQSVTLSLIKDPTARDHGMRATPPVPRVASPNASGPLVLPIQPTLKLPRFGLGVAGHDHPSGPLELQRVAALQLSHLRADLRLANSSWTRTLASAAGEAKAAGTGLELALHLPAADAGSEIVALRDLLHRLPVMTARVMVFCQGEATTSADALMTVREGLQLAGIPVGGGSDAHFCELNRARALGDFNPAAADFVSWPVTPQVHAFDNQSILETLEAQPHTVASARAFAEGRPLVVSPVTLRPRLNTAATASEEERKPGELPSQVDPRQMSLFNAAWTLGSMAALTGAGASSATYFETTGWCGVMESRAGSPLPEKFPSIPGAVFPVYFVFAAVAGFHRAAPLLGSDPRALASLVLFDETNRRRVLLANLTPQDQTVRVIAKGSKTRGWLLDEDNVEDAMREPESFLARSCEWQPGAAGVLEISLKRNALAWFDLE